MNLVFVLISILTCSGTCTFLLSSWIKVGYSSTKLEGDDFQEHCQCSGPSTEPIEWTIDGENLPDDYGDIESEVSKKISFLNVTHVTTRHQGRLCCSQPSSEADCVQLKVEKCTRVPTLRIELTNMTLAESSVNGRNVRLNGTVEIQCTLTGYCQLAISNGFMSLRINGELDRMTFDENPQLKIYKDSSGVTIRNKTDTFQKQVQDGDTVECLWTDQKLGILNQSMKVNFESAENPITTVDDRGTDFPVYVTVGVVAGTIALVVAIVTIIVRKKRNRRQQQIQQIQQTQQAQRDNPSQSQQDQQSGQRSQRAAESESDGNIQLRSLGNRSQSMPTIMNDPSQHHPGEQRNQHVQPHVQPSAESENNGNIQPQSLGNKSQSMPTIMNNPSQLQPVEQSTQENNGNQQPQPSTGLKSHGNKQLHGLGNQDLGADQLCGDDSLADSQKNSGNEAVTTSANAQGEVHITLSVAGTRAGQVAVVVTPAFSQGHEQQLNQTQQVLQAHWQDLRDRLRPELVIDKLLSKQVLSFDDLEDVRAKKTRHSQAEKLLHKIWTRSDQEIRLFAEVLSSQTSGVQDLGTKLMKELKIEVLTV